jgi:hypothetical protein
MLKRICAAFVLALAACVPAYATTVRPMTLDDIVGSAAIAFEGTCISNRTQLDSATHSVVTYTLFEVNDVLKGTVPSSYEIKQIGGQLPDGMTYEIHGIPKFTPGQNYVVFLAGVSSAGFSSPMGLSQGSFDVAMDASGAKVVRNGRDFGDMMANIPDVQLPAAVAKSRAANGRSSEMNLDTFKSLVRDRVNTLRGPQ